MTQCSTQTIYFSSGPRAKHRDFGGVQIIYWAWYLPKLWCKIFGMRLRKIIEVEGKQNEHINI